MKKINFIGRYTAIFLSVILFSSIVTSCKENEDDIVKPKTITDVILQNSEFSILREIILGADMSDDLRGENITLFAPNDAAFRASSITSALVLAKPDSARAFVLKHIIKENLSYNLLKAAPGNHKSVLDGYNVFVKTATSSDSTVTVNGANIITRNVNADNGTIQVVNKTLVTVK